MKTVTLFPGVLANFNQSR